MAKEKVADEMGLEGLGLGDDGLDISEFDVGDMDNLDLGNVEGFGDINIDVEEPHIRINTKSLKEAMKAVCSVASLSGRDILSRSVMFDTTEPGKVMLRATDFDTTFSIVLKIENTEKVLNEKFAIPCDVLIKLLKAVPTMTIISQREGKYYMYLGSGNIIIENVMVDFDKYNHPVVEEHVGNLPANDLYRGIRDYSALVVAAVAPNEKRIMFLDGKMVAQHFYSLIESGGYKLNF